MDKYFRANAVLSIFSKNIMELKKGLPVRPSEMGVLNIITRTTGLYTPVMLAELLRVSKPMITAHIASLESKGYITKAPSLQDKRVYYVLPTEEAKALVERARIDMESQFNYLIDAMGEEEFDTFVRLAELANHIMANKGE